MPTEEKKARNLLQQEPGWECHREASDDTQTLPQTRIPCQHHETAESYLHVVVNLSSHFRVIVCKDGIQWILQRRDAARSGQPRWKGVRYCTEREALIRDSRALDPLICRDALDALKALPERFGCAKPLRKGFLHMCTPSKGEGNMSSKNAQSIPVSEVLF